MSTPIKANQQGNAYFSVAFSLLLVVIVVKLRTQLDKKAEKLDRFIPGYHVVIKGLRLFKLRPVHRLGRMQMPRKKRKQPGFIQTAVFRPLLRQ